MSPSVTPSRTVATRTIALVVATALFMENIDSTILSTALPTIAADLGVNPLALKLALTSYLVSLAIFIPPSGWIADRFGGKRVFTVAVLVFMAGSLACTQVSSLSGFVVARFLQGMGGAMMVPVGRLIVVRSTPKEGFVNAMAWLTMPALLGPVLGPLIGGIIVTNYPWHWIFLINIPVGLACLALSLALLPSELPRAVGRFDAMGFVLSGLALSALMLGSMEITEMTGPSPTMLGLLLFGAAMAVMTVRHCNRITDPILDLALLHISTYRTSVVGGTLFRTGIGAIPFLLPLMLQLGFGLSAIESGALTFVSALGALFMKPVNGPILRRHGFRRVLVVNGVLAVASLGAIGLFRPDTPHLVIYAVLFLGGCLRSIQFTSLNAIAFADLTPEQMSRATSLSSAAQQVSLGLGVTLGATAVAGAMSLRGGTTLASTDFQPAFGIVAAVALLSVLAFRRLPADAGARLSGRPPRLEE